MLNSYKIDTTPQTRPALPKRARITERDRLILAAMGEYEGFLSVKQVQRLFFNPTKGGFSKARKRLNYLWRAQQLDQFPPRERMQVPEQIYWKTRKPRIDRVPHDMAVNDFHIDVVQACHQKTDLELVEWHTGFDFATFADTVTFEDFRGKTVTRKYLPDGFFWIQQTRQHGKPQDYRFLLEIDTGHEQNHRVFNEKVLRAIPYIDSPAYQSRFGKNGGRLLIVTQGKDQTSGERRIQILKTKTERRFPKLAQWCLFTTFQKVFSHTVLDEPIWTKGGSPRPVRLLDG